jgi:predicted nucleic acid-binding Zn ribbon protein
MRRHPQPIRNLLRRQRFAALSDAKRERAAPRGARLHAVDASLSPPAPERDASPVPVPARAVGDLRTPHTARLCEVCGRPLTGRRPQRVCSPRCRIARWRQARAEATAATLARLQAENTALRQRVGELERLGGALKGRLQARPLAR